MADYKKLIKNKYHLNHKSMNGLLLLIYIMVSSNTKLKNIIYEQKKYFCVLEVLGKIFLSIIIYFVIIHSQIEKKMYCYIIALNI